MEVYIGVTNQRRAKLVGEKILVLYGGRSDQPMVCVHPDMKFLRTTARDWVKGTERGTSVLPSVLPVDSYTESEILTAYNSYVNEIGIVV